MFNELAGRNIVDSTVPIGQSLSSGEGGQMDGEAILAGKDLDAVPGSICFGLIYATHHDVLICTYWALLSRLSDVRLQGTYISWVSTQRL